MVIVIGNGQGSTSSNPVRGWLHFTEYSFSYESNESNFFPTDHEEEKLWIQTCQIPLKNLTCVSSCPCRGGCKYIHNCCRIQIRPVEEQLKQRVIGKRYCISRKKKSYNGSTCNHRLIDLSTNIFPNIFNTRLTRTHIRTHFHIQTFIYIYSNIMSIYACI